MHTCAFEWPTLLIYEIRGIIWVSLGNLRGNCESGAGQVSE